MNQIGDPDLRMGERVFVMGMAAWSPQVIPPLRPVKQRKRQRKRRVKMRVD